MKELKIKLMERKLGAELTAHLGYEDGKDAPPSQPNRRNGKSAKHLKGQDVELPIAVPCDRDGSFEPELVKKGRTRIDGMDDKIIGLYGPHKTLYSRWKRWSETGILARMTAGGRRAWRREDRDDRLSLVASRSTAWQRTRPT